MSDGLLSWRRIVDAEVRERKLALARARQLLARVEQIEKLLYEERGRRDALVREQRERGELPSFADERTNALLERAIERAGEKVAVAKLTETGAVDRLREAWQRVAAIDRLLERRAVRAELEAQRSSQKELDEIAGRRSFAAAMTALTSLNSLTSPTWTDEDRR